MRLLLAWIALTLTASAQDRSMPPGWVLFVVQGESCYWCEKFKADYHTQPQFRHALETAFAIKACNWERPSERMWAQRRGVQALPSFLVYRDGVLQQTVTGYNGNWRAFLDKLEVDVGGAGGTQDGTPAPVRPISPEERELPRISALESEIGKLRRMIADATTKPQPGGKPAESGAASGMTGAAGTSGAGPVSLPSAPPPQPSQGAIPEPASGVGADWAKLGAAAVTLLAPQFALPAGAVASAITALQWLRKRRTVANAQRPQQNTQTIIERPVVVATDTPPAPQRVEQTTHYVPIEQDSFREAYQWAVDQYTRKFPGSEGLTQALGHLISQYSSAKGQK
jgi:hypothetical protein